MVKEKLYRQTSPDFWIDGNDLDHVVHAIYVIGEEVHRKEAEILGMSKFKEIAERPFLADMAYHRQIVYARIMNNRSLSDEDKTKALHGILFNHRLSTDIYVGKFGDVNGDFDERGVIDTFQDEPVHSLDSVLRDDSGRSVKLRDLFRELVQSPVYYLSCAEEMGLLKGAVKQGEIPKEISVGEKHIFPTKIAFRRSRDVEIPFDFDGYGHLWDIFHGTKVRTREDYERMVNQVLPAVHNHRAYVQQEEARARPLFRGLLARLGGHKPFDPTKKYV